ncbi:protein phosphatase 2C domain-containing protein [Paenibacillus hemerocallicola]|uniref:Protein phosphatase 2C domain-containing protein n=2 Tax=Paenibacillus hemerocallicola TaxID=1172614 RepID=A0A5C4SY82_9BACL|nr:protein phosphatase 2C domain-containing protein [Paenibacillus hemerocallicola]
MTGGIHALMLEKLDYVSIKGEQPLNEDALVLNSLAGLFGVLDGATSLTPYVNRNNETGGYIAANLLKAHFERLSGPTDVRGELLEANRKLRAEMAEQGIDVDRKERLWSAAAAVVQIHEHTVSFAQAGDCMLLAVYRDGTVRPLTRPQLSHIDSVTLAKWQEGRERGLETKQQLRAYIYETIKANRERSNTPDGYSVINGEEAASHYVEYGTVNRIRLQHLVMLSDGIYLPGRDSAEPSYWTDLAEAVVSRGLRAYAEELVRFEQEDPDGKRHLRLKKSDDKSGVIVSFHRPQHMEGASR